MTQCEVICDASDKLSKVEDVYERVDREVSTQSTNTATHITVATAQETLPTAV